MLNDSTLSTILFRIEHLFDGQPSPSSSPSTIQKSLDTNRQNLFHTTTTTNDVLPDMSLTNDLVDDLDRYLINGDHLSDSSHTSSPSVPLQQTSLSNQFEFILNALTASSARINEETTTYLNQGQPYEIKFRFNHNSSSTTESTLPTIYRSILRLCFWDKILQSQERDLMQKWLNEYQSSTLFDIDMNLTYGVLSIIRSRHIPNAVEIIWDTSTTTSLFIRFKCTSTDFAHKRHGGEKGIPLRIQIDTYHEYDVDDIKHLHSCCCKIQLFRLKGAQRKNKADQIKIDKLNFDQRRRYQTTLEYTTLQSCNVSTLYTLNLLSLSYSPEDLSDVYTQSIGTINELILEKKESDDEKQIKSNQNINLLTTSLSDIKYTCKDIQNNQEENLLKITIHTTNEHLLNWLNKNHFNSILNRFQHYTGIDILRLTINDITRICNNDHSISIRLYNQLHETAIRPLKTLYIKTTNTDVYSAIYLHTLTRDELSEKIFQLIQQTQQETYNFLVEFNKIKIKIDNDNVVKYSLPNEGQFYLKIFHYDIILYLINNSS